MSLSSAQSAVSFSFPAPDASAAGPGNLSGVWARSDPGEQEVALLYGGTAVTIFVEPSPYTGDTAARFASLVSQASGSASQASLGAVDGNVALILAPNDPTTYQPTMVEFVQNGVDIRVTSTTYGTSTLMDIADNMAAQAASGTTQSSSKKSATRPHHKTALTR
jgi:hypothetical protein